MVLIDFFFSPLKFVKVCKGYLVNERILESTSTLHYFYIPSILMRVLYLSIDRNQPSSTEEKVGRLKCLHQWQQQWQQQRQQWLTTNKQRRNSFWTEKIVVTIIKSRHILFYAKINSTGEQKFTNVLDKMSVLKKKDWRPADGIHSQALSNIHTSILKWLDRAHC